MLTKTLKETDVCHYYKMCRGWMKILGFSGFSVFVLNLTDILTLSWASAY